ncbi:hypothetical protein LSG31_10090 [Fodinisporobacter ferrooxydans]|uniref:Uncharacterized protein n=1 Tax=Fodinisporobacter ferrooxydans TaxID=2901836 RepID=A0ABY4CPP8_9BACL|nr:hypothetical protein LSG31_10090 [Alicyclobacillaceae bacterium MYW30-H2]
MSTSHAETISYNKTEFAILGLVLVIALVAALVAVLNYNNEENNVALSAVQKLAAEPVRIDYVDEQNHYYVTDSKTIWKETLVQVNGQWKAENIQRVGDFKTKN